MLSPDQFRSAYVNYYNTFFETGLEDRRPRFWSLTSVVPWQSGTRSIMTRQINVPVEAQPLQDRIANIPVQPVDLETRLIMIMRYGMNIAFDEEDIETGRVPSPTELLDSMLASCDRTLDKIAINALTGIALNDEFLYTPFPDRGKNWVPVTYGAKDVANKQLIDFTVAPGAAVPTVDLNSLGITPEKITKAMNILNENDVPGPYVLLGSPHAMSNLLLDERISTSIWNDRYTMKDGAMVGPWGGVDYYMQSMFLNNNISPGANAGAANPYYGRNIAAGWNASLYARIGNLERMYLVSPQFIQRAERTWQVKAPNPSHFVYELPLWGKYGFSRKTEKAVVTIDVKSYDYDKMPSSIPQQRYAAIGNLVPPAPRAFDEFNVPNIIEGSN